MRLIGRLVTAAVGSIDRNGGDGCEKLGRANAGSEATATEGEARSERASIERLTASGGGAAKTIT